MPIGTLLACVASILIMETFVPRYQATHLMQARTDYLVYQGITPTVSDLARMEKDLLLSPHVLHPVLADAKVRQSPSIPADPADAEATILNNLNVVSGGHRSRMAISFQDTDPEIAALICNAVATQYLKVREQFDTRDMDKLAERLTPEILRQEHVVEEVRAQYERRARSVIGYAPGQRIEEGEFENQLATLNVLQTQITDLRVRIAVHNAQGDLGTLNAESGLENQQFFAPPSRVQRISPTESQIVAAIEEDSKVKDAKERYEYYKNLVINLEVQDADKWDRGNFAEKKSDRDLALADLEKMRGEARPRVEASLNSLADNQFDRAKEQENAAIAFLQRQHTESIKQSRFDREQQRLLEQAMIGRRGQELESELEALEEEYDRERTRVDSYAGDQSQLLFAEQELELETNTLQKLRERVDAIELESQNSGAVKTLAPAMVPSTPMEAMPFKKMLVASGAAFLLPFLFGLLWEYRVQRVTDSSAVATANLAPVVGELARLPSNAESTKGRRVFEESVDTMRSNLFMSLGTRDSRSIAVVSSMSGEGKSSVASQLALSIAKATGETVLLVDTDLRCPDQHEIFGLDSGPGITAVLSGKASLDTAVDRSLGEMIHVLPAGRLDQSPHRLMSIDKMREFVEASLKEYRYVVFDTAPVLSAGETLSVASVVDSTLVCVMRDVSRIDNVTRTTRRLEAAGANIAGTVFSGVTARQYSYRYGDYHYAVAQGTTAAR